MCQHFVPSGLVGVWLVVLSATPITGKETSGPQVGEKITSFKMRGVLDDERGKDIDLVQEAAGKPLLLYFLHERSRPSIALARQVLSDAVDRKSEGLAAGLVMLTPDVAGTEEWIGMVRQVLPRGVPIGISTEGPQGPPAYGLSGKVVVTVIVVNDNRVVANFALDQPSLDDAPAIAAAVKAVLPKSGDAKK